MDLVYGYLLLSGLFAFGLSNRVLIFHEWNCMFTRFTMSSTACVESRLPRYEDQAQLEQAIFEPPFLVFFLGERSDPKES